VSVRDGEGWAVDLVADGDGPWFVATMTRTHSPEAGVDYTDQVPTFHDLDEAAKFAGAMVTALAWIAKARG
jgi:hypothetical protein